MARFWGLLFLFFIFLKPVKMGKCWVPLGLHPSVQLPPPPPAPPTRRELRITWAENTTWLARSLGSPSSKARLQGGPRAGRVVGPMKAPGAGLPAGASAFLGGMGIPRLEEPGLRMSLPALRPSLSQLLASAPREAQVGGCSVLSLGSALPITSLVSQPVGASCPFLSWAEVKVEKGGQ